MFSFHFTCLPVAFIFLFVFVVRYNLWRMSVIHIASFILYSTAMVIQLLLSVPYSKWMIWIFFWNVQNLKKKTIRKIVKKMKGSITFNGLLDYKMIPIWMEVMYIFYATSFDSLGRNDSFRNNNYSILRICETGDVFKQLFMHEYDFSFCSWISWKFRKKS